MRLLVIALNVFGWPLIQLALARLFLLISDEVFAGDSWLTRTRHFERNGRFYRQLLLIQRWKGLLPDGATWLGGRSKKLQSRRHSDLITFAIEARRAEIAHWCMLLCTPMFYLWNPLWACVVMSVYGIAANLPCILVQRANRIKIERILRGPHTATAPDMHTAGSITSVS